MGRLVVQQDYFPTGTFDSFNNSGNGRTNNNQPNGIVVENNPLNDNRSFEEIWSTDSLMAANGLSNSTSSNQQQSSNGQFFSQQNQSGGFSR